MNYKENRKEHIKEHKIITSIDRVKLSYQLTNKNRESILNENFKLLDRVKRGRITEIGLYGIYINLIDQDVIYKFIRAFSKSSTAEYKKMKIKELDTPINDILNEGKKYHFYDYVEINHRESLIIGFNQNVRLVKNKNYFTMEVNDIIQNKPDQDIYTTCRKTLEHLIKTDIFNLKSDDNTESLLKDFSVSEIEIAIDLHHEYGKQFYDILSGNDSDKLLKYKNTIYFNNATYGNTSNRKDWKWKYYNKSLKDRFDKGIRSERFQIDDVYRFEITICRDYLKKFFSIDDLKLNQDLILEKLRPYTKNAIRTFSDFFDYDLLKEFLIYNGELGITKRNYKNKIFDNQMLLIH